MESSLAGRRSRWGFPYKVSWYTQVFGDGETPYALYLERGSHTLTLRVNLGQIAPTLRNVEDIVFSLNYPLPQDHHDHRHHPGRVPGL